MSYSGCYSTALHHMPLSGTLFWYGPIGPTAHQRAPPACMVVFSWPVVVDFPACLTVMDDRWEAYTSANTNSDQPAPCCAAGEPQELLASSSDFPEKDQEALGPSAQMPQTLQPPPETQPTLLQPLAPPLPAPAQPWPTIAPEYPLYPQSHCLSRKLWQHRRAQCNHSYCICTHRSKMWRQWRPGPAHDRNCLLELDTASMSGGSGHGTTGGDSIQFWSLTPGA